MRTGPSRLAAALTLRGSYTEAFHPPTVLQLNPAGSQAFPLVVGPVFELHFESGRGTHQWQPIPNENLSGAIFEGLDYEAIYILDSTIFGHGDYGRLTTTINGHLVVPS